MWRSQTQTLDNGRIQRVTLLDDDLPLAYSSVLDLWIDDESFRSFFVDLIRNSEFTALRWETPCVTTLKMEREFEFVFVDCPSLDRPVDVGAFSSHFTDADVVTFENLGRDAILVVPCPASNDTNYGHIASFVRGAPDHQVHAFWSAVGKAMKERINNKPTWLSTAGMGVSWLHVRLDDRPKYYAFKPFTNPPA